MAAAASENAEMRGLIALLRKRIDALELVNAIADAERTAVPAASASAAAAATPPAVPDDIATRMAELERIVRQHSDALDQVRVMCAESIQRLGSSLQSVHQGVHVTIRMWSRAFDEVMRMVKPVAHIFEADGDALDPAELSGTPTAAAEDDTSAAAAAAAAVAIAVAVTDAAGAADAAVGAAEDDTLKGVLYGPAAPPPQDAVALAIAAATQAGAHVREQHLQQQQQQGY